MKEAAIHIVDEAYLLFSHLEEVLKASGKIGSVVEKVIIAIVSTYTRVPKITVVARVTIAIVTMVFALEVGNVATVINHMEVIIVVIHILDNLHWILKVNYSQLFEALTSLVVMIALALSLAALDSCIFISILLRKLLTFTLLRPSLY